ncbi:MAG: ammonium transporter [Bacillota bacterium]
MGTRWRCIPRWIGFLAVLAGFLAASPALAANDPTGAATLAKDPNAAVNFIWVLLTGACVIFMMTGFAMVETGFTRARHANNTMMMNLMVWAVGGFAFALIGFALMFGGVGGAFGPLDKLLTVKIAGRAWGLLGLKGFGLLDVYDVSVFLLFFFQVAFLDTALTIPSGAMAERIKFSSYLVYAFLAGSFIYPLFGNWAWGGGWLSQLGQLGLGGGYKDFAGSGAVHAVGGLMALAGAMVLGPRLGKFVKGKPVAIPGHDLGMGVLGTMLLIFCWFSFNCGSTFAATDLRLAVVGVNTLLAGCAGGLAAMFYMWATTGKPETSMSCNGILAGLVAVTAPCAYVPAWAAALIGLVAGVLVCLSVYFVEHKLRVDDPVGAVSVHGANGLWGVISVGLFADGTYGGIKGLFFGGGFGQLGAQLMGVGALLLVIFPLSFLMFKAIDKVMGLRVPAQDELAGLDIPVHGAPCYPEFNISSGFSVPTGGAISRAVVSYRNDAAAKEV